MLKPFLRNVSGKPSKSDITMFTGGLNTCEDKTLIRDNQMPYMWNMTLNKGMSMTTRSNRTSFASFLQDTTNWGSGEIKKMFATSDKTLLTIEKNGANTEVYELKKNSNYLTKDYIGQVENSAFYSITECRDSNYKYFYISTLGKLYEVKKDSLSETLTDVTSTSNNSVGILASHKNRLWVGNGLRLKFSTLREYTDFMSDYEVSYVQGDTDYFTINKSTFLSDLATLELNVGYYRVRAVNSSGTVTMTVARYDSQSAYWSTSPTIPTTAFTSINTQDGDEKEIYITVGTDGTAGEINITNANGDIKALVPFDDKLIILCERSMHVLYGDSPLSEINQFTIVDFNNGIGCISDETWTICNKQLFWLDTDMSVYRYNGAGINKVSEPYGTDGYASYGGIKGISIDPTQMKKFIMSSYGDCVYMGITRIRRDYKNMLDISKGLVGKSIASASGALINNNYSATGENYIEVEPNTKYTFSAKESCSRLRIAQYAADKAFIQRTESSADQAKYTITTSATTKYLRWSVYYDGTTIVTEELMLSLKLQLELGATATSYVPYASIINDTLLVYNTQNRVWWAEDGAFSHMCKWETDTQTPFYYTTDYLVGSMYNNDILILNALQNTDTDYLFNMSTRHFDDVPIEYAFETKTWTLGTIKKEKTLSNLWFQANAKGRVAVGDYWNEHNVWDEAVTKLDENYLILGELKKVVIRHNVQNPTASLHQGTERQRFIIPRMYLQKINAFSIRVEGEGFGEFYMMEKEWRIK